MAIFNRKKALADYSYDELMQERAKLEAAEQKTLRDLRKLEDEKTRNFEDAKRANSDAVRQVHARKIRDINHRIDGLQGNIRRVGKLIRVVDLTMAQMEQGRLAQAGSPIVKAIAGTDSLDMQAWVDQVVAGESVAEQKLDDLLKAFDDAEDLRGRVATGDAEVDAILAEIQRAAATEALTSELSWSADSEPGAVDATRS
jgi:hypothetical protein